MKRLELLDTTLRDGAQARGISFSVEDRLAIAATLDSLGIPLIELGNPAASPREAETFRRASSLALQTARLCAFGSTRRKDGDTAEDLAPIVNSGASVAVIFGKAWIYHVREVLATSPEENLRMIEDSIRYLTRRGTEVIFDAEHYFDGTAEDPAYAHAVLRTALDAGARTVVLCDTNGGTFPDAVSHAVREAVRPLQSLQISLAQKHFEGTNWAMVMHFPREPLHSHRFEMRAKDDRKVDG